MKKIFALLFISLWLTSCGQTGPLYLPPEKPDVQKAPVEKSVKEITVKHTKHSK